MSDEFGCPVNGLREAVGWAIFWIMFLDLLARFIR